MNDMNRPPGKTTIAPDVLLTIARLTTLEVEGVSRMSLEPGGVNRYFRSGIGDGVRILIEDERVYIDLYIIMDNNVNVREVSRNVQEAVTRAISKMVGMDVGRVDVHIDDIDFPKDPVEEA